MTREEAKQLFRSDKDAYGKPRHIMKNIDKIYDHLEQEIERLKAERVLCECCKNSLVEEQGDWCQECLDNPCRIITN